MGRCPPAPGGEGQTAPVGGGGHCRRYPLFFQIFQQGKQPRLHRHRAPRQVLPAQLADALLHRVERVIRPEFLQENPADLCLTSAHNPFNQVPVGNPHLFGSLPAQPLGEALGIQHQAVHIKNNRLDHHIFPSHTYVVFPDPSFNSLPDF